MTSQDARKALHQRNGTYSQSSVKAIEKKEIVRDSLIVTYYKHNRNWSY